MKVEITWDNGDQTYLQRFEEDEEFIKDLRSGKLFKTVQSNSKFSVNLSKARMIEILEDDET